MNSSKRQKTSVKKTTLTTGSSIAISNSDGIAADATTVCSKQQSFSTTRSDDEVTVIIVDDSNTATSKDVDGDSMVVYTGHRNGTIQKWNLLSSTIAHAGKDPTLSSSKQSAVVWTSVACTDLTQKEEFCNTKLLGVAGLKLISSSLTPTGEAATKEDAKGESSKQQLYSWNYQREDMRDSINGIPNKIMIWDTSNGNRIHAIMIDVGRCTKTKLYANPLPHVLLRIQVWTNDITTKDTSIATKYWNDCILVGLQATCEYNENDVVEANDQASTTAPPAVTAALPPTATTVAKPKGRTIGIVLPFDIHSRKILKCSNDADSKLWTVPNSNCFVRAMIYVASQDYVIGICETIRMEEEITADGDVAVIADVATLSERTTTNSAGGQISCIVIWDCKHSPGSILYKLDTTPPSMLFRTSSISTMQTLIGMMWCSTQQDIEEPRSTTKVFLTAVCDSSNEEEGKDSNNSKLQQQLQTVCLHVTRSDTINDGKSRHTANDSNISIRITPTNDDSGSKDTGTIVTQRQSSRLSILSYSLSNKNNSSSTTAEQNQLAPSSSSTYDDSNNTEVVQKRIIEKPLLANRNHHVDHVTALTVCSSGTSNDNSTLIVGTKSGCIQHWSDTTALFPPTSNAALEQSHDSITNIPSSINSTKFVSTNDDMSCSTCLPGLRNQLCPHVSHAVNNATALKNECCIQ